MLKNMKALPRAILIAALVAGPIWAYQKFVPKSAPKQGPVEVQVQEQAALTMPAAGMKLDDASSAVTAAREAAEAAPASQEPAHGLTPATNSGIGAVLRAGQK